MMNKTLFLMGLVCLLSACTSSTCRYGDYAHNCNYAWGGSPCSDRQIYAMGSNITLKKAQAELDDCKSRGYETKFSSTMPYCMAKKGYISACALEYWTQKGLSKDEALKGIIERVENKLRREEFKEYRYLLIE